MKSVQWVGRRNWILGAGCILSLLLAQATLTAADGISNEPADYTQQEMPERPQPAWVEMMDQGEQDAELKGLMTPRGVRVEVVAREPVLIDPVGMMFRDDGTPFVLEWREATEQVDTTYEVHYQDGTVANVNRKIKNSRDVMKQLIDADHDGRYEASRVVLDDLEYPSMVMEHEGWYYFPSVGHVIRRKASDEQGPFDRQEEILRGLCGYHHHQVSGLTLSPDRWLYTTTGDDDNRAEGSDGSRATVLRTGAIFRSRPDGSRVTEFARGFRNPYRNIVFDERLNWFHVDNDQEDGSKFQGVRLMHLLEGADYGWRLQMGAKCCRTDFARGAVFGERPGKMPSMLKVGRGAPAGLLLYQQPQFPAFFRGLLIYPDCFRKLVRAYRVEPRGATFEVVEQFTLMEWPDDRFRPVQAVAGPDGAIYILDWHTNSGGAGRSWGDGQFGRLYRLSWSGTDKTPEIPMGSRDAWKDLAEQTDEGLVGALQSEDFELRLRAHRQLVKRQSIPRTRWMEWVRDRKLPTPMRILALAALNVDYQSDVQQLSLELLRDEPDDDLRRQACEAIGYHVTQTLVERQLITELATAAERDKHAGVRRAAAMALGAVASISESSRRREIAEHLGPIYRASDPADVWLHDGYLRGLERCGAEGIAWLVAWAQHASASTTERECERIVRTFAALRERPAVAGLDALLAGNLSGYTDNQIGQLLEAYRFIQLDPPISPAGVERWLAAHPQASPMLRVTALETLGLVGGGASPLVHDLAKELAEHSDSAIRVAALRAIQDLRIVTLASFLVEALTDERRSTDERRVVLSTLGALRAEGWPYLDRQDAGVELVVDALMDCVEQPGARDVHLEILLLVAQIAPDRAQQAARLLLESQEAAVVAAAIDVLGADRDSAIQIADRYIDGRLPRTVLPHVAASLQKHVGRTPDATVADRMQTLFQGGLQLTLEPAEVTRIEELVKSSGNPDRGADVLRNVEKSQCLKCHRLEGIGAQVGPDLTKIWQTHSVAKMMESVLAPSKEIKEGYAAWTVETQAGQVYAGLKISDNSREIVLRDHTGRDIRIARPEIEVLEASPRSLMPEGTVSQLTLQEFVDLISFLRDGEAQRRFATSPQPTSRSERK